MVQYCTFFPGLFYVQIIPPYNGYGFLEDSLQNCFSLIPQPPRKNIIKMLENDHKIMRYAVRMVSCHDLQFSE